VHPTRHSPKSGSFRRWGGPNGIATNQVIRIYVDYDNKQVFIFTNGNQQASWTGIDRGSGISVGASFYDKEASLEIVQMTPGQDNGYGAWREWGMQMERQGATIFSRVNAWETARATQWITKGQKIVTMKVVSTNGSTMAGCFRRDFMNYEQHPHSSNQGDIHPEAWVWYQSGNRFYNYAPFGGSFKRVSTASSRYVTNQFVQIRADASGRGCYASWRGGASGSFTLIAQWTNLNIGRGMAVGLSTSNTKDAFAIVEEPKKSG
jgi:hypothetical protein